MSAEQKNILLVEDEAILALSTKQQLEKYGYKVKIIHRGEEAVALVLNNDDVDLVLMDINLGSGMDGPEAAALWDAIRILP